MWADFKFPPINLHNVWQSKYMRELEGDDMSALDKQVDGDHYKNTEDSTSGVHSR